MTRIRTIVGHCTPIPSFWWLFALCEATTNPTAFDIRSKQPTVTHHFSVSQKKCTSLHNSVIIQTNSSNRQLQLRSHFLTFKSKLEDNNDNDDEDHEICCHSFAVAIMVCLVDDGSGNDAGYQRCLRSSIGTSRGPHSCSHVATIRYCFQNRPSCLESARGNGCFLFE